jgi:hypothetical protein
MARFRLLQRCRVSLRVGVQSALDGDLNPTNVALDVSEGTVRGYIFDASGVSAGVNIRDLAMLEVTSQLHLPVGAASNVVTAMCGLYETADFVPAGSQPTGLSERGQNTRSLIAGLRRAAAAYPDAPEVVYAISVFDHALIQLGGLDFAVSRNKIRDPEHAAELAARAAHWIEMVCPGLCSTKQEASA